MDFGRRLGASDEHIPQWICKERATTPPSKRHAALRVAPNLARGFVARSVEYRCGYTPPLAPRHGPNWVQRTSAYSSNRPPSQDFPNGWPVVSFQALPAGHLQLGPGQAPPTQ